MLPNAGPRDAVSYSTEEADENIMLIPNCLIADPGYGAVIEHTTMLKEGGNLMSHHENPVSKR